MKEIQITLSLKELHTIVDTMNSYAALHISSDYEAEEVTEMLENIITAYEEKNKKERSSQQIGV